MLRDFGRWLMKIALQMVFWVFVLSISWERRTLFERAHEILIENPLVEMVHEEGARLCVKIYETGKLTFAQLSEKNDKNEKR